MAIAPGRLAGAIRAMLGILVKLGILVVLVVLGIQDILVAWIVLDSPGERTRRHCGMR